jgi:acetolactate synthase-1/3 small subunit
MSLLRRRGFPIGGVTIERTHQPDVGRMTVLVQEARATEQVRRHLDKLPDVIAVSAHDGDAVCREYALVRIRCAPHQRPELLSILEEFEARAIREAEEHLVLEAAGPTARLDAFFAALEPYGIEESARTSPLALRASSPAIDRAGQLSAVSNQPSPQEQNRKETS